MPTHPCAGSHQDQAREAPQQDVSWLNVGGDEQHQLASVLASEPPSMAVLPLSMQAWLEVFVCAGLSVRLIQKVKWMQGTPCCNGLLPACLQAAAAQGLAGKRLGSPADDNGSEPASTPAPATASQLLSEHRPAQPGCERSLASTAAGSCSRQPENDTGPARFAAAPAPAGTACPQQAQLVVCMLTGRKDPPAGQDGSYSPLVDPAAGSYSPLMGSAALPGRQSPAGPSGAQTEAPGPLQAGRGCPQAGPELPVGTCAKSSSCPDVSSEPEEGEVPAAEQEATSRQPLSGSASAETSSQAGRSMEGGFLEAQQPAAASCQPAATLPSGSWWGIGFCEGLDSDGEGVAVEEASPQTVLVQNHQVGARLAVFG